MGWNLEVDVDRDEWAVALAYRHIQAKEPNPIFWYW